MIDQHSTGRLFMLVFDPSLGLSSHCFHLFSATKQLPHLVKARTWRRHFPFFGTCELQGDRPDQLTAIAGNGSWVPRRLPVDSSKKIVNGVRFGNRFPGTVLSGPQSVAGAYVGQELGIVAGFHFSDPGSQDSPRPS